VGLPANDLGQGITELVTTIRWRVAMDCHCVLALASSKITSACLLYVHTWIPEYLLSILGKRSPHTSSFALKGQYLYFFLFFLFLPLPISPWNGNTSMSHSAMPCEHQIVLSKYKGCQIHFCLKNLLNLHQKNWPGVSDTENADVALLLLLKMLI